MEIDDIDEPSLKPGEVKIQVKAFGLNKGESLYRSGSPVYRGAFVPGQALGIEAVGEVIEDSSGELKKGQKVGTPMGGMMFDRHGGYAEIISVMKGN